jgi:hypothetical protein
MFGQTRKELEISVQKLPLSASIFTGSPTNEP